MTNINYWYKWLFPYTQTQNTHASRQSPVALLVCVFKRSFLSQTQPKWGNNSQLLSPLFLWRQIGVSAFMHHTCFLSLFTFSSFTCRLCSRVSSPAAELSFCLAVSSSSANCLLLFSLRSSNSSSRKLSRCCSMGTFTTERPSTRLVISHTLSFFFLQCKLNNRC